MEIELKQGNLCFIKQLLADLIVVVKEVEGERVSVVMLDAPPYSPPLLLPIGEVVKMAEEQERILPTEVVAAVAKQREVVFTPQKKRAKIPSLEALLKRAPKETLEEILNSLSDEGIYEGAVEKEEAYENGR